LPDKSSRRFHGFALCNEKKVLFVELKKFSEFKLLLNEFLQIGENLNITNEEITAEVESFRKEHFA